MIIGVVLKPKKEKDMSQEKRLLELVVHTTTLEELKKVVKVAKDVGYSVPECSYQLLDIIPQFSLEIKIQVFSLSS